VTNVVDDQGRETVDRIEEGSGEAIYVSADLSRRSNVERLVHLGGMEPGLMGEPDKIKHIDLTGTDDGYAETSQSGAE
jgi:hypothetical protein